jgi:uncharacterized protein YbjT (DUF2867 family)
MKIVIAGGHGQIALRLGQQLAMRGDDVVGLIRNPSHAADLADVGATAVIADLENTTAKNLADALSGADVVVFAAGAGPGSGAARKDTVDRGGAVLTADAAELAGVRRYLLISAMGPDRADQPDIDPVFAAYLRAKLASEDDLRQRDLDWVILRPGRLTNKPGTGNVTLTPSVERSSVTRDDVASVIAALVDRPQIARVTLELDNGDVSISDAVAAIR